MLTAGRERWLSPVTSSSLGSVCCCAFSLPRWGDWGACNWFPLQNMCRNKCGCGSLVCRLRCLQSLEMLLMGQNLHTERRQPCSNPLVSPTWCRPCPYHVQSALFFQFSAQTVPDISSCHGVAMTFVFYMNRDGSWRCSVSWAGIWPMESQSQPAMKRPPCISILTSLFDLHGTQADQDRGKIK